MSITPQQLDNLINKLNAAVTANQTYADAHITSDSPAAVADTVYEASYELCHALSALLPKIGVS